MIQSSDNPGGERVPEPRGDLSDLLRAQARTNDLLGEMRADIAGVKQAIDSQAARIADIRESQADVFDRLRSCELRLERLPQVEREILTLQTGYQSIESRVRGLEVGGARTDVVTGGVSRFGWHVITAAVSATASAVAVFLGVGK